jgi:hypothetical protein
MWPRVVAGVVASAVGGALVLARPRVVAITAVVLPTVIVTARVVILAIGAGEVSTAALVAPEFAVGGPLGALTVVAARVAVPGAVP